MAIIVIGQKRIYKQLLTINEVYVIIIFEIYNHILGGDSSMFKFKKLILASLAVATMLTIAPMPSFAAENTTIEVKQVPMNWGSIDFKKNANNQSVVTMDQDGEVTAQGWKKSVVVWGLRNGGSAFHKITEWLGFGTKEAKYLKDNASKIADSLERLNHKSNKG